MSLRSNVFKLFLYAVALVAVTLLAWQHRPRPVQAGPDGIVPPAWTLPLPADLCPGVTTDTNCHYSSPAIADLTHDGLPDVVVATNNGHVVAVAHDGSPLWDVDVATYFGMTPGTQTIASSPAVADVDDDGSLEIAVGAGSITPGICTANGVIVLEHTGTVKAGWPAQTESGCGQGVFGTPALGDLDLDGDLEIVVGGLDRRLYVWHHNGTPVAGFPIASNLFPILGWPDLESHLAGPIYASPALADLDGNGFLDILIGTNEGNTELSGGWDCPYTLPPGWPSGYCGGSLYAVNGDGDVLPGFPRYVHEVIESTPAVGDVNGDGAPELFVGTGTFYHDHSPDHPTDGFRLYGLDNEGNELPGWAGGKAVNGGTPASPSLGDIDGDGELEIVIATSRPGRVLYAWHADGQPVNGFPMVPQDQTGNTPPAFGIGTGFILADTDGDEAMEIVFALGWTVTIVDGDGTQLTASSYPFTVPLYLTDGTLLNTPAGGDLDGDGQLELIAQNSTLTVWNLPDSTGQADWPLFKRDAARTGNFTPFVPIDYLHDAFLPIITR